MRSGPGRLPALLASLFCTAPVSAAMDDDPWINTFHVDQFEWLTESGESELAWEAGVSFARVNYGFLLETEGESSDEGTEEFEVRALYTRPVLPFWNVNAGLRADLQPEKQRGWLALEFEGLAPGFVESRLSAYLGDAGRTAARLEAEVEWYLTPGWEFVPGAELNISGQDDAVNGIGAGVTSFELGARFRYRIRPDLMPYIGVEWTRLFGGTADYARAEGEDARRLQWLAGLHFWF